MSAEATRLESLLLLVRDGRSSQIRDNAAEKLGQVAARSPACCASIVQQLRPLVIDPEWDIRVAASKCLDVVARSLRTEDGNVAALFALVSLGTREASGVALNLKTVDITQVVLEGAPLLRSGGEEYHYTTNVTEEARRIYAVKQRRLLLKRLSAASESIWKTREDTLTKQLLPRLNRSHAQEIVDDIEASEAQPPNNKGLVETTARKQAIEMLSFSQRFKRRPVNDIVKDTREKRTKMDLGTGSYDVAMEVENSSCGRIGGAEMQTKAIIVANLVSDLFESMFDSKWEVRHGALLSLRQILLSCHLTAAIEALRPAMQDSEQHTCVNNWVEECLIRCICVLALDQFVDYSADESISPVREVCAQVFGVLLGSLSSKETLIEYLQVVRTLFSRSTWQACHGGLLGLKYLIRAHSNHGEALVPLVFNDIAMAFSRSSFEEDVLVLAADMLKEFAAYLDRVDSATVIKTALLLWRSLKLHDGAGLVKASIVQALSAWYSYVPVATLLQNDKAVKAAIWQHLSYTVPMLHHHSQFVRTSSATCAAAILSGEFASFKLRSIGFSRAFLPHLLFQMLLEDDETIQQSLLLAWKRAASSLSKGALLMDVLAENLPVWTKLLWCPADIKSLNVKVVHSDGTTTDVDVSSSTDRVAKQNVSSRVIFADAIGFAVAHVPLSHSCMTELVQLFRDGLCCSSGERQCGTLLALLKWGCSEKQLHCDNMNEQSQRLDHLQASVGHVVETFAADQWRQPPSNTISTSPFYSEQLRSLQRIFQMETRIIEIFFAAGITLKPSQKLAFGSTANISRHIAEHVALFPYHKLQSHPNEFEIAHFKRQDVFLVDELIQEQFSRFYHRVQGLGSSAYLELLPIPKKSGFLIKALMDSIKEEKEPVFRSISSRTVADFVVSQAGTQKKCVEKIVSNLCSSATALVGLRTIDDDDMSEDKELQKESSHSLAPDLVKKTKVRVDGAACALRELCKCGGASLFQVCHALEDRISKAWTYPEVDDVTIQRCMHLIGLVVPHVDGSAMTTCLTWLDHLALLTQQPHTDQRTRRDVAHAIATITKHAEGKHREIAMFAVYKSIFAVFSHGAPASINLSKEVLEDAAMVLDSIVHTLGAELVPYVPSLVYYAMKTMSSHVEFVRTCAAKAFAALVPLIPLQMDLEPRRPGHILPDSLRTIVQQNEVSRTFLQSFIEGKAVQPTDVKPLLAPGTSLRVYQQHGVDWLCFMAQNNLHGILADDMGLGKTLQTLAAMVAIVATRKSKDEEMPCLVVCPPIVISHWIQETKRYIPGFFASIIDYSRPASERKALNNGHGIPISEQGPTLILTTYSILRADIQSLASVSYAYVVLDEAHLIRNPTTAVFQAVRKLRASHRIALSGTPLQNNVTDLWALFEFLMPGYLGDFARFRREYTLPITKSKERNATTKQKEVAAIAIARLHQKVLPFLLRRTKDQVLKELPPKIISNILLPLSSLQRRLYVLASSRESIRTSTAAKRGDEHGETKPLTNVLTNLQLLRKICVHPALAVDDAISRALSATEKKALLSWKCSGKLTGLRDLLVECCDVAAWTRGASRVAASDTDDFDDTNFSPHRCLVFAHLQQTLNLTEQMLKDALPGVTYRRLDGQTPPSKRTDIVQRFNADPSIDVLLLTTAVGGLGLTLTGADTVIFIEHSWNPFVDLQAMDRAHRIGQKRTVRVFRLIMEETLEEHILNLQEFKEQVASTVVQKIDASTGMSSNTKDILNLLQVSSSAIVAKELRGTVAQDKVESGDPAAAAFPQTAQRLLDEIGELWNESQYESLAFPEAADK